MATKELITGQQLCGELTKVIRAAEKNCTPEARLLVDTVGALLQIAPSGLLQHAFTSLKGIATTASMTAGYRTTNYEKRRGS